jgi:uncharacterized protein YbbC (DUF1343 family)
MVCISFYFIVTQSSSIEREFGVLYLGIMIKTGLDTIESGWPKKLRGLRAGLVVHPASVNRFLEHSVDILLRSKKVKLTALFGPQHGIRGESQDNMIEWEGFQDGKTGLPVYSLYGTTREPDESMLGDIEVMIVDLQDIGSRYYTFIWTMDLCMRACTKADKPIVILDRPNPINGIQAEGPVLDPAYTSFVGLDPLPVRHGMTIGEIGNYLWAEFYPSLDFHVVRMKGWKRKMWFDETGLPWVPPSPNIPTLDSAIVYPGMCLLEGITVSEGRGTTRPFEIFGAPFIDPDKLTQMLNRLKLPGVSFRSLYFEPTFQKHAGQLCGGAQIHVLNRKRFRPFKTAIAVIKVIHDLYPDHFSWKQPPYEYETEKLPIDILTGADRIRNDIEKGKKLNKMEDWWTDQCTAFIKEKRKRYLIYE